MILPGHTQQHDLLRLWQCWHKQDVKTRLARERSQEKRTHRLFFTINYSPLFTIRKNISNTVI
ncbi:hypothetical protein FKO18_28535 [Klebsiella pneumoniae]|nr:hypothetical protein [Klebsiella pneumoniae]HBX5309579.1 hypothetical protein [Klebsiella pneumoniae]HBZ1108127.1 hypothetical protein [Klebsiella pneumoniae]